MPAISRVRRKWSIDIGISRLISVGMRAITFVLHQQVVCAALKSYNSHIRSNASDSSIAILSPFNAYMHYAHQSHSAAAPDASESSPGGLDEPPLARSSSGMESSESRRSICFPQYKGRDRRKCRKTSVPPCDGGVRRWPSVRDDRRSTVRRPNHNYRILASQTGETSIHKLSELTLPLSSYAALVPPSDHRVLIDRLIVILDYVWLHPTRSTRRVHSAWRVSCLVSVWTFFRSLSPSRTHSVSRTGSWVGMLTQIRAVYICDN